MKSIEENPLYTIANPRSIALFGVSNSFSMGTVIYKNIKHFEFPGPLYIIHPREEHVQGVNAFPSIRDCPDVPELAIIVLPAQMVGETLAACGQKGVKHAIVISGGFKEIGDSGKELEREMMTIAREYGIRLLGPNCIGVTNPHYQLNTTTFPYVAPSGYMGMVSQSGSFIVQMFTYLSRMGIGFSTAFSVGNEADLDCVDCLEYLALCPHTKVIALYLEGIRRGREFLDAARAITPHKPVVALYVGGSEGGGNAGRSHTGALAGPDYLYEGAFRQSGIIRARSVTELFDFCYVLGNTPLPKGRRVVIQTDSGGPGAAAADACSRAGLALTSLSPETVEKLTEYVPYTASIRNPVDITFYKNPEYYTEGIPRTLLTDENTDMLLVYLLMPWEIISLFMENMGMNREQAARESLTMLNQQSASLARLAQELGKPVIRDVSEEVIQELMHQGVTVFHGSERAARALDALSRYASIRKRMQSASVERVSTG
jgi:acetyl-CoA synthetase (ADP-forming)